MNHAQEHMQRKREEYSTLMILLEERVQEMNANRGDMPEIVLRTSSIQMGDFILQLEFDQRYASPTDFVLVLKVGQARPPMFGSEPPAVRHNFQPRVSDDLSSIVWRGDMGYLKQLTTPEVVTLALDMLIGFYRKHNRK